MRTIFILFHLIVLGWGTSTAWATESCEEVTEKPCEVRKHSGCGPIDLNPPTGASVAKSCELVYITLTPTEVMPHLRRLQCTFFGDDSRIRFSGENYVAMMGPAVGETFEVRNGAAQIPIFGRYSSMSQPARIKFQNLGPGRRVLLKCNGYGPA